eukprot:TRINITY_DN3155_c0_g2_i1.p1 TRINITY_DN3155_c0_g2~~TRINITY_DN3155_c0_g2_i1.p1  ORF type:complete len:311 (-),score=51.97 TRINITY_DN3155_c0_g2_i1:37-969(-)
MTVHLRIHFSFMRTYWLRRVRSAPAAISKMPHKRQRVPFKCPVCFDRYKKAISLQCGHRLHRICLRKQAQTDSESFKVTKCPLLECRHVLTQADLRAVLTPTQYQQYLDRNLEATLAKMDNVWRCPRPDCTGGGIIDAAATSVFCPVCNACICLSCNNKAHDGSSCADSDEASDPRLQMVADGLLARCPCGVFIAKTEGCNSILCSVCCEVFCRKCGKTMKFGDTHGPECGGTRYLDALPKDSIQLDLDADPVNENEFAALGGRLAAMEQRAMQRREQERIDFEFMRKYAATAATAAATAHDDDDSDDDD